jgi:hypothetical protein
MTAPIFIRKNKHTRWKVEHKSDSVHVAALQKLPGMDRERVIWRRKYVSAMFEALFPAKEGEQ